MCVDEGERDVRGYQDPKNYRTGISENAQKTGMKEVRPGEHARTCQGSPPPQMRMERGEPLNQFAYVFAHGIWSLGPISWD